jgi:hypothetical protein
MRAAFRRDLPPRARGGAVNSGGLRNSRSLPDVDLHRASRRFIQFFTANIRNRNTHAAYARLVKQFFDWCEDRRLELEEINIA